MTNRMLTLRTLVFIAGCIASGGVQAQNANIAFEDGCPRQPPEMIRPMVIDKLGELEAALSRGNLKQAEKYIHAAEGAASDVAGWTGALVVKCLGEPLYGRYFKDSQELVQLTARMRPDDAVNLVRAALWNAVNDSGKGAEYILQVIPEQYNQYSQAWGDLTGAAETIAYYREIGAFVLPEEAAIEHQALQALDLIDAHAKQHSQEALASEAEAFYRDPTEFEKDGARTLEDLSQLAGAMAGVEIDAAEQTEFQLASQRIRESRERLDEARGWEFSANFKSEQSPANQRAAGRGDEVLSWAANEKLSFTTRDEYYEHALDYYNWCSCKNKAAQAFTAKETIQPQLKAEKARRQAQADEAEERLKGQAEDMQRALDDMQKTDAEKKAFEDEADELEAELGF